MSPLARKIAAFAAHESEADTKLHGEIESHGLTPTEPPYKHPGYRHNSWHGEVADKKSTLKSLHKHLQGAGYVYRGKSYARQKPGQATIHHYRHETKYEMNKPYHDVTVSVKKNHITVHKQTPTEARQALSQRRYKHGDAEIMGHNEGTIHHRTATGPTKKSVEDAYDHYLKGMGTDRATEEHKRGSSIMTQEAKGYNAFEHDGKKYPKHWTKSWHHFRDDT